MITITDHVTKAKEKSTTKIITSKIRATSKGKKTIKDLIFKRQQELFLNGQNSLIIKKEGESRASHKNISNTNHDDPEERTSADRMDSKKKRRPGSEVTTHINPVLIYIYTASPIAVLLFALFFYLKYQGFVKDRILELISRMRN